MNGSTVVGRSGPAASPQAVTTPWYFVWLMTLARIAEPTVSTAAAHVSDSIGRAGSFISSRVRNVVAPSSPRYSCVSGRPVTAATSKPRRASRATLSDPTPPAAPVTMTGPSDGVHAGLLDRRDTQHRGEPGRADRHRVETRHPVGATNDELRAHPLALGVPTPEPLAHPPAREDHAVADREVGRIARRDGAGEIDPGHHRVAAHDPALPGQRQPVLVVERRVVDVDRHVALGQVGVAQLLDRSRRRRLRIVRVVAQHQSVERVGHPRIVPPPEPAMRNPRL